MLEDLIQMQQAVNTADLSITKIANLDSVELGADLTYVLTVTNKGPNPAGRVKIVDVLPQGVSHKGNTANCVEQTSEETLASTLMCDLGALLPGRDREVEITVSTTGISLSGVPIFITNTATVENIVEFAGPDPEPSDNFTSTTTPLIRRRGDLDGDGDVDQNDLNILLADRGKSVSQSACGAICDLDDDGKTTALDARKLQLLCTRPRCVTE